MPEDRVYLPAVLADNYGIATEEALRQMQLGEVTIDGHDISGRDFWFYPEALEGKRVMVKTASKQYAFEYVPARFRA